MNAAPITSFASLQLNARYLEYREEGFFAADGLLNELGRMAWGATRAESGPKKGVASALATVFCEAASLLEGIPISVEKGERWFGYVDGPIMAALSVLTDTSGDDANSIVVDLLSAFDKVRPEISN